MGVMMGVGVRGKGVETVGEVEEVGWAGDGGESWGGGQVRGTSRSQHKRV